MGGMTARQALGVGFALFGAVMLLVLLVVLHRVLAVLFLGAVLGLTLSPIADWLAHYRFPRVLSVLLVYILIAVALGLFGWYAADSIAHDFDKFSATTLDIPGGYQLPSGDQIRSYVRDNIGGISGTVTNGVFVAASVAVDFVTVFIVSILFVVSRDRLQRLVLDNTPPRHREETHRIMLLLGHRIRRAVLGLFLGMAAVGILVYVGLRIIGLPFPFILAFFAFLTELLPFIGPWLGFIPALLIALTQGWVMIVKVAIVYLIVQQFENHVLVPVLHSKVNQIPALLVVIAVLIGGALMGIIGALVAIPIAVIFETLFFEAFEPWWQRRMSAEGDVEGRESLSPD
jgi:predicted PurR-regulated permease PerM